MTLKSDAKFLKKVNLHSKKDMRNSVNINPTTQKSKHLILMGYFVQRVWGLSYFVQSAWGLS